MSSKELKKTPPKQAAPKSSTETQEATPDQTTPTTPPKIVLRSKEGLKLITAFKADDDKSICSEEIVLAKIEDRSNRVESVCCSEDGELLAWCDDHVIKCIRIETQEVVFEQPNAQKSNCLMISPKSTKLVSYSTMSGGDNLHFWDLYSQKHLVSMPFTKASQWKPAFSMNEDICLLNINRQLILYAGGKFDTPKQRISHLKVDDFSLSTASVDNTRFQHLYAKRIANKTHYIAVYSAGIRGQPSIVKIYKYPNLTNSITNKSFFKEDRVKFSWSPSGNSLLLTCQADFDSSGKSYYGEQSLNYMNVKGESYFVKLPKEGQITQLEWLPSLSEDMFVCIYGLVPYRVSVFNNKCEVVFNLAEGGFNGASFSPFGNMIAVYGIGSLAGGLYIWDFDKKKMIANWRVPETTGLEWCADGKHLLTYTTSPRLRVSNGYRLWHYTGCLLYEQVGNNDPTQNLEIYDVLWQTKPGKFKKPKCDSKPSQLPNLMKESKLAKFQGSAGKYVPPSMRAGASQSSGGGGLMDPAIGIGAGGVPIVGLESLSLGKKGNNPRRNRNKNKPKPAKTNQ